MEGWQACDNEWRVCEQMCICMRSVGKIGKIGMIGMIGMIGKMLTYVTTIDE